MKQYLFGVMHPDQYDPPPANIEQIMADVDALNAELMAEDRWVFAGGLHPASTATVVDASGEKTLFTDGPFNETKEVMGGFWVLKAEDLDDALAVAERCSRACQVPIEVRPFQDDPQ
jgi:hypothetical protein